ncbi:helix-turn-helix transcriptional regulator [Megasphaera elsdenii]|uniref:ArsR/SmtB family transcription factor n=1 Tax=Megasphaera elsdenii TaxID=907 RepID=UPI00195B5017|nr:metalloregulator ArsR/SmtB family transcription factor [Megasphaera elsdenii]MBM6702169.1 winged helix-turn-helix transcriptional regulator [Megasphaera elsdenii]
MKRQAPELSQQYIQPLADVFKVLGDPTRLRILRVLMNQEVCVRDIADELGMGQSAVSHQLRILRDARLVQFRRDGKTIYYSLADAHVFTLLDVGLEHVAE